MAIDIVARGLAKKGGGKEGPPGNNGLSTYELAVLAGFEGSLQEWLESIKGKDAEDFSVITNMELEELINMQT